MGFITTGSPQFTHENDAQNTSKQPQQNTVHATCTQLRGYFCSLAVILAYFSRNSQGHLFSILFGTRTVLGEKGRRQ
jgi:hypothetical protein